MRENNYILIILNELISQELAIMQKEEKELREMPPGKLIARKRKNGKWFYSKKENGKEYGITKDSTKISILARKQHLINSSFIHKKNVLLLNNTFSLLKENIENSIATNLSPAHKQGKYNATELQWLQSIKSQNPFSRDHLIYKCNNGLMVRSKSERIIANKLLEYGLVFMYEAPIEIDGVVYYPDFIILKKDGTIVLWEHNGLMNNEEYFIKALQKIRKYKKKGFVQHKNLICTEEDDIRDESMLDEIIIRFLL